MTTRLTRRKAIMPVAVAQTARSEAIANALPFALLTLAASGRITSANNAAENFFGMSAAALERLTLVELIPFGSPLLALADQSLKQGQALSEYDVELSSPRLGAREVDVHVTPLAEAPGALMVLIQERTIAHKMTRQLSRRHAARSVTAMAAILAHEIKNPLAGIRGAAQLIEQNANADDRMLTQLIVTETGRIGAIVDRMEVLSDNRPIVPKPVNIHEVLGHVRRLAETSFAARVHFVEVYDPSLPPALGDRDRLTQAILNLVKNAADAVEGQARPEIQLQTAYRAGVYFMSGSGGVRASLPLEVTVRDNGTGIAPELLPSIFEPFVTSKAKGTGLGLALTAKIVADHGGMIECDAEPGRTLFRIRLPVERMTANTRNAGP